MYPLFDWQLDVLRREAGLLRARIAVFITARADMVRRWGNMPGIENPANRRTFDNDLAFLDGLIADYERLAAAYEARIELPESGSSSNQDPV